MTKEQKIVVISEKEAEIENLGLECKRLIQEYSKMVKLSTQNAIESLKKEISQLKSQIEP